MNHSLLALLHPCPPLPAARLPFSNTRTHSFPWSETSERQPLPLPSPPFPECTGPVPECTGSAPERSGLGIRCLVRSPSSVLVALEPNSERTASVLSHAGRNQPISCLTALSAN